MATTAQLQTAYNRCNLSQHGISFERAISEPMFARCLQHVADALDHINQPPLPKHQPAPIRAYKD